MNWNHRLAAWIVDLLCPTLGKARRQAERSKESVRTWGFDCPDFLEPDELREEDDHRMDAMVYWKPQITEYNRKRLEALWTKK